MAFCIKCGAELSDGAAFCASCGTAQRTAQQAAPQPNPAPAAPQAQQPQAQPQQPQGQYQQYQAQQPQQPAAPQTDYAQMFKDFWAKVVSWFKKELDTEDHSAMLDPRDVRDNKVFGIFAYLGLFVLIPMFAAPKNSKFSRYHSNQGLLLLLCNVVYSIVASLLSLIKVPVRSFGFTIGYTTPIAVSIIIGILSLPFLALAVLGIVNVVRGKCKDLPFIGKFKILKVK